MGRYDSSRTRVSPFFTALYDNDPTGAAWLDALIQLGTNHGAVRRVPTNQRLVAQHGRRWGDQEYSLPAPKGLLKFLVANLEPKLVDRSHDTGDVRLRRKALADRDASMISEALRLLEVEPLGRHWYVLEGPSKPDALLETERYVLCIEGKRTEAKCTTHTTWMRTRSQLLRHMDAARDHFVDKAVYGLLIVEGDSTGASDFWQAECQAQTRDDMVTSSLPHRAPDEQRELAEGVLGVTTWRAACAAVGLDWQIMPDKADL